MPHMNAQQMNLFGFDPDGDSLTTKIQDFKNRTAKAKEVFELIEIEKSLAYDFIRRYHYLGNAEFFAKYAFGLWCCGELVGVATYSNPQGTTTLLGWFGVDNTDQTILELSRLAMLPELNGCNATSYLLSNSIKELRRIGIRAVITLADASRHVGSIYQVCNFKYYGLADEKNDFYRYPDGKKNPRGETKNTEGVWINRTRKHRYAFIMDKKLKCLYQEQPFPSASQVYTTICCGGVELCMIIAINSITHARSAQAK